MGKTPTKSRKDLRSPAPYRRSRDTTPTPLARIQLVPAPAVVPAAVPAPPVPAPPASARTAPVLPELPPLDLPMPVAELAPPLTALPDLGELLAAAHTSLGFAAAALTALPHPDDLVHGDPAAPEPPPGRVPAGDARSLRTSDQFALVYRHGATVVSRRGKLGQRGSWQAVDYPTAALAARAYALECSKLMGQGFRDVP